MNTKTWELTDLTCLDATNHIGQTGQSVHVRYQEHINRTGNRKQF